MVPDLEDYMTYLNSYYTVRKEQFLTRYRRCSQMSSKNHVESYHKSLKAEIGSSGLTLNVRVDRIVNFIVNKIQLRVSLALSKENGSYRLRQLKIHHNESVRSFASFNIEIESQCS